jgi:hypothetical protein
MNARANKEWALRLTVTEVTLRTFFIKLIRAFTKDAKPESTKQQTMKSQVAEPAARDLMRVCCLWHSLKDRDNATEGVIHRVASLLEIRHPPWQLP